MYRVYNRHRHHQYANIAGVAYRVGGMDIDHQSKNSSCSVALMARNGVAALAAAAYQCRSVALA